MSNDNAQSRRGTHQDTAYFDSGQREELEDGHVWHGTGYVTPEGEVCLPIDRENSVVIKEDGTTRFVHAR